MDPSNARVLVVEDDRDNLTVALDLLALAGVTHVAPAATIAEVPAALARLGQVDLALLDIDLPDGDGRELAGALRARPECATARIVAVSASVMPDDVERAQAVGFDGFIGKPLDFDRFPEQLQALLDGLAVWSAR
jgi:two-component system cell cycle response regulator DivK